MTGLNATSCRMSLTTHNVLCLYLLLMLLLAGDIERNPLPIRLHSLDIGQLNISSLSNKTSLLHCFASIPYTYLLLIRPGFSSIFRFTLHVLTPRSFENLYLSFQATHRCWLYIFISHRLSLTRRAASAPSCT